MIASVILFGMAVVCTLTFIRPKIGALLIWPILFTYPHAWWYYNVPLPMNIGYDSLFTVFLFITVVLHVHLVAREPVRLSWGFWVITVFTLIAIISNLAGAYSLSAVEMGVYYREILRMGVYWAMFYAILHTVDNRQDLMRHLWVFLIAASAGGAILIVQYFNPGVVEIFGSPQWLERREFEVGTRAGGPFMSPNSAAVILGAAILIALALARLQEQRAHKTWLLALVAVMGIGFLATQSRSGAIAMGVALIVMAVLSTNRRYAWLVLAGGLLVLPFTEGVRYALMERFAFVSNPMDISTYDASALSRFEVWSMHLNAISGMDLFFGKGRLVSIHQVGMHTHSTYITLIAVYGIGGVVWFLASAVAYWRAMHLTRQYNHPTMVMLTSGVGLAMLCWLVSGLALDMVGARYGTYLMFFLVFVMDRIHAVARDETFYWQQVQHQTSYYPLETIMRRRTDSAAEV